jgi:serine/threonine protein kinase/tetratricopeptide (TPR) repeat protein
MSSTDSGTWSHIAHAASTATLDPSDDSRLAAALVEYCALVDEGRLPGRSEFLARHGSIAGPLEECLAGLELIHHAAGEFRPSSEGDPAVGAADQPSLLGEFRIIREIGRGGMGIVYEAEQLPLGRRVALKVLPSSASLDPRHRQRFQVEAQAAALLHHEHIVPVFGSGSDRGIHYYAMQLIDGRPLTRVVQELASRQPTEDHAGAQAPATEVGDRKATPSRIHGPSSQGRTHARETARLGLQAALALEHAHGIGVIHRDIKPSNLLIDGRGHLWVTDFGLARLPQEEFDLTRTGDLVGTLRYMSPEQVRAERGGVTAATDVYSLGATLYELLTLRPAFDAPDRQGLVRMILEDEPVPPRRIDPSLPRDLETIILKAMEKEPAARYGSAADLADDLRRFLDDQPIRARRPGLVERAVKWSRRHRPTVLAGVAALIVTLAASTAVLWEAKRRTDASAVELREAKRRAEDTAADLREANRRTEVTLSETQAALSGQFQNLEFTLGTIQQITRPLVPRLADDAARSEEARCALLQAISYYDRLTKDYSKSKGLKEQVAKAYREIGFCRLALGRAEGRENYRQAIRLFEELAARFPDHYWLRTHLIATLHEYARLLPNPGDRGEAESSFRRALAVAASLIDDPGVANHCYTMALVGPLNDLAWALVRRPDVTPSDAAMALRLARRATEWEPAQAPFWNSLGLVHYRLGDDPSARAAFQKSMDLNSGGGPADWFYLAALDHRAGKKEEARRWFDRGVAWMEKNQGGGAEREAELESTRREVSAILAQ